MIHLLEYFNFCSLSIDLHAYSEIFCNGTAFLTSDTTHYIQTSFIKNRFNVSQRIDFLALVRSHKDSYVLGQKVRISKHPEKLEFYKNRLCRNLLIRKISINFD